jgi:hypothetical protein
LIVPVTEFGSIASALRIESGKSDAAAPAPARLAEIFRKSRRLFVTAR